jgi:hypothetical protein
MCEQFSHSVNNETITVGGDSADIAGYDSHAIQIAADALKASGGGRIELKAGVFELEGPVRLYSNIHLTGQGDKTILKKADGFISAFADDVDYGANYAKVIDPSGFKAGIGILIKDIQHQYGWVTSTSKITKVIGNAIYFDRLTLMDYQMKDGGTVSTASSMIEAIKAENVIVSDLLLDGNKDWNDTMDGCRGGAVYLHKVSACRLENVVIRNYNGDGVSWQITKDISLDNVEVSGCTGIGMHPGTGSFNTSVRNCSAHNNGIDGLFVCWRVQESAFQNNSFYENGASGISIGHKDSGDLFEGNHIHSNAMAGITVRDEDVQNSANNNIFRGNIIENNGVGLPGCGILIKSAVSGNIIEGNTIRNTVSGNQIAGIVSHCGFSALTICDNIMSGHEKGDQIVTFSD